MERFCCGVDRDIVVPRQCHDEVKVCKVCIGWLRSKAGIVDATLRPPRIPTHHAVAPTRPGLRPATSIAATARILRE